MRRAQNERNDPEGSKIYHQHYERALLLYNIFFTTAVFPADQDLLPAPCLTLKLPGTKVVQFANSEDLDERLNFILTVSPLALDIQYGTA